MQSTGASSIRHLAEITGEDWSYIARLLRILKLPEPIKSFLLENQGPAVVKYFHLRRLLELARLGDEDVQFARFRQILEEARLVGPSIL